MADNILPFPVPHQGDPEPRRMALASIGFQWREGDPYYNEHYLHSSLGYKTPNQFERDYYSHHSPPFLAA